MSLSDCGHVGVLPCRDVTLLLHYAYIIELVEVLLEIHISIMLPFSSMDKGVVMVISSGVNIFGSDAVKALLVIC